jgi:hypothetical protein
MTQQGLEERLIFLVRVVKKEVEHLEYSSNQIFSQPITAETLNILLQNPSFASDLEAFTSRFSRLQDMVGDKLLPAWLLASGEKIKPAIDNLMVAEKFDLLDSAEKWIEIRQLRNQMVHEYIESIEVLTDAINRAYEYQISLKKFAFNLIQAVEK